MYEFKWCGGALDQNPDDLALVLSLDANVTLLVVLGIALKKRMHSCWMKVGHALVPELGFIGGNSGKWDSDAICALGDADGGGESGDGGMRCRCLADKEDPSDPVARYCGR